MNFRALDRGELVAIIGGILLGVSLFLPWYSLGNAHTVLNNCHGPNGSCTGWASLSVVRYILLIAAVAPAILAYIVLRGHALSWPRGELTAVVSLVSLVITLFVGVIDKPGSPDDQITVAIGWWLALLASLMILVGAIWRSRESGARRKPPGVL